MECGSCGMNVRAKKNFVRFMCPECGEGEIIRCFNCKMLSNKYECGKCSFVGP